MDAISVHKSLVRLTPQDEIQLVSVHTPQTKIDPSRLKGEFKCSPYILYHRFVSIEYEIIIGASFKYTTV